jgi:hypothetical protein
VVVRQGIVSVVIQARRVLFAALASACFTVPAVADVLNARMAGDASLFEALVLTAKTSPCNSLVCHLPTQPIIVSLKAPHGSHMQIALTKAKVSRPHVEGDDAQDAPRPILLRGTTLDSRDDGATRTAKRRRPVAATIFFDTPGDPTLEVMVAHKPSRKGRASRGFIVFRAPLSQLRNPPRLNARVQAQSSQAFSTQKCGSHSPFADLAPEEKIAATRHVAAQASYKVLYIGTDFDAKFATRAKCSSASSCRNRIVSIVNQAAVFYERQLGFTLEVARQFGPTNHGRDTMSELVLDNFQEYNYINRSQFIHTGNNSDPNQVDLFQLFTGRTMDEEVIGVAYVGTLCRNLQSRFSNAIVQYVSKTLDPITTAHEVGHTLNAQHTNAGIMRPNLGSTPPTSFSDASLAVLSAYLTQWYPECRQGISNGIVAPTPAPGGSNPFAGKPVTLQLSVASSSPKTLTFSSTVSSINPACSLRVHAASSARGAYLGEQILERAVTTSSTSVVGTAPSRVRPDKKKNSNIYFFAEYSCSDGSTLEVSKIVKFNPNKVKGIAKRARSKQSWIKALKNSLR